MNLSLVLLVLSVFVAYLIYDMFKKTRQQQQLAQAQQPQTQFSPGKLRPSYAAECTILRQLHENRMNSLIHKSISIHLIEEPTEKTELSQESIDKLVQIIERVKTTHNVHLLVCRKTVVSNPLINLLRSVGVNQIGFQSTEGAVAVLRQLNCHIHLESQQSLYKTIVQYLSNVWLADSGKSEVAVNQYRSELQMLLTLSYLNAKKDKGKQQ